jgi:hypothetical protein
LEPMSPDEFGSDAKGLWIYRRWPLSDADLERQLRRMLDVLGELASAEPEERTWSEAEVLESAGLE